MAFCPLSIGGREGSSTGCARVIMEQEEEARGCGSRLARPRSGEYQGSLPPSLSVSGETMAAGCKHNPGVLRGC